MSDTIFMRIIKGELPAYKLYEDKLTLAFLNIHPSQPGHTLVIPKKPVEQLWDLPDEDYAAVMATAKKVALRLRQVLGTERIGVKVIGVDVPHAHIHLIPFSNAAEFYAEEDMSSEVDQAGLSSMAERLAITEERS